MASIDWGTMALGALVGIGCRKQLKSAAKVAANTAASLAGVAAQAAADVAKETKSPEQQAAERKVAEINQNIDQLLGQKNG